MNRPQSYANHRRLPPVYLAAGAVILVEACHLAWLAVSAPSFWSVWAALGGGALLIVWYASRRCAQIVQDRVIRLEMQLRLERLLGSARRADFARLSLPQVVALRFAGDAELPALVDDTLAGKLVKPNEIKRRIQDWQADWLRV
jgi:hypothetical protein